MKLLILSNIFTPGVRGGGPIKSLTNIIEYLSDDIEIGVITKSKDLGEVENYEGIKIEEWMYKDKYVVKYFEKFKINQLYKSIIEFNPDTIYINSLFSPLSIISYLLLPFIKNRRIILAPRGELNVNALKFKSKKKTIFIKILKIFNLSKKVTFHATSLDEEKDIKKIFKNAFIETIENLPAKIEDSTTLYTKKKNILNMVTVARVSKMKNIDFILEVLTNIKGGKLTLDIFGPIEDEEYYKQCLKISSRISENIQINFKGEIDNSLIQTTIKNYDLFVLPTLGENFGHSIVESLQANVPLLISNNTPWRNLEMSNVGFDLDLKSPEKFIEIINYLLPMTNNEYKQKFTGFKSYLQKNLNTELIVENYLNLFKENENE